MPIYEYLCEKCGHEFEREQRITEDPVKKCPECRANKVRRLISRTAFVLKGSGWYSDLYSSSKPAGDTKESDAPAAEAKPEPKSDTKAEPKSETKSESKSKGPGKGKKSTKAA